MLVKHGPQTQQAQASGVNLAEALSLLRQAGYPDPTLEGIEGARVLQSVIDGLCELSMHDGLTGLANARYFRMALEREVHRASRTGETCSLLMLDLDHFKAVNDAYGHPAGDVVLRAVGRALAENLRPMDMVARYGGEEFAVILPNCLSAYAAQVGDRLRTRIAREAIHIGGQTVLHVTVSVGVASTAPWARPNAAALVESADRSLYQAKSQGRNRVWVEAEATTAVSSKERAALFNRPDKE